MANKHHCEKTGKFLHGDVVRGFRIPEAQPVTGVLVPVPTDAPGGARTHVVVPDPKPKR